MESNRALIAYTVVLLKKIAGRCCWLVGEGRRLASPRVPSCSPAPAGLWVSAGMARATAGIDHAGQPEEGGAVSNAKELKSRAPADP